MNVTYSSVLMRALVIGLIAGGAAGLYLLAIAEPTLDDAIRLEDAGAEHAQHHSPPGPLFSRADQKLGGVAATVLYGGMLGVVFGTLYASIRHRTTARSDLGRVLSLATAGFATTALLPALKYPPTLPGVGEPSTIDERSLQFVAFVACCVAAAVVIAKLSGKLRRSLRRAHRLVVLAGTTIVVYGFAFVSFPAASARIESSAQRELIMRFRIESLGGQALLWAVLAVGLGWSIDQLRSTGSSEGSLSESTSA